MEGTMDVHHIRYRGKRGKSELPGDLVTLCRECHFGLHDELGRRGLTVESQLVVIERGV